MRERGGVRVIIHDDSAGAADFTDGIQYRKRRRRVCNVHRHDTAGAGAIGAKAVAQYTKENKVLTGGGRVGIAYGVALHILVLQVDIPVRIYGYFVCR